METKLCQDQRQWQALCEQTKNTEFLQSFAWGEFQRSVGKKPLRLLIGSGPDAIGVQGFENRLPFGLRYLSCPRIPSLSVQQLQAVRVYAREAGYAFVRIEPSGACEPVEDALYRDSLQPQQTMILNLLQTPTELLGRMHAKTRYNIHVAVKKGLEIKNEKQADVFWQLNKQTTVRGRFVSHDRAYYEHMLKCEMTHQLTAYFNDVPVASHILIQYGDTLTYLHGASANEHRNVMGPYMLQWEGIKFGQSLGLSHYDFWGVAPIATGDVPQESFHQFSWHAGHRWSGITKFKAGFGGTYHAYPRAFDLPCDTGPYRRYRLLKTIRRWFSF